MPFPPGLPPVDVALAIRAWNMLGGMEWAGLDAVADILGIDDLEILVTQLQIIRNWQAEHQGD